MTEETKIFAGQEFDVTTERAAWARKQAEDELRMIEEELADPDEIPALRRRAERQKETAEATAKFFEDRDDEMIVGIARSIFEKGQVLEASGLSAEKVATQIYEEIPEAGMVTAITEYTSWGYMLNQLHFAHGLEQDVAARESE